MAITQCLDPSIFNGALRINWFGPMSNHGDPANFAADAYSDPAGVTAVTVLQANAGQAVTVSTCAPAPGMRCNLEAGTGLLLAQNNTGAPIRLSFSGNGVSAVGAFMVSKVPFGSPFTPQIWVLANGGNTPANFRGLQGVTGDIWQNPGDSVAPFVGAMASGGDRITSVLFDAIHPTTLGFDPLGIGYLYYLE